MLLFMICVTSARADEARVARIAGEMQAFSIQSQSLGQEREVLVALPRDYELGNDRYPVVYVLDADWHFLSAVAAIRYLSETSYVSAHRIPPLIVVGITSIDRDKEDTPTHCVSQHGMSFPTSGGADAFLTFVEDELVVEVDRRYRTHPYRVLCGWSLGGLLSVHALIDRPELFGGHIAISPSLWWDEELLVTRGIALAQSGGARERDLVLTIGTAEEGSLCYNSVHRLLDSWNEAPIAGLSLSFLEIDGEDHNHSPYKAIFDGLRSLFADWFYPEAVFAAGLDSLDAHYASLSRRRGYIVGMPDHLYDPLARTMLAENRPDDAIAVMKRLCDLDPDSPISCYRLGEICRQANDTVQARDAYRRAVALERAISDPDTVFINWVQARLSSLEANQ